MHNTTGDVSLPTLWEDRDGSWLVEQVPEEHLAHPALEVTHFNPLDAGVSPVELATDPVARHSVGRYQTSRDDHVDGRCAQ